MAETGVTVIVADPNIVGSWIDAALTVTDVLAVTACAVNNPLASMVPTLAPHETAVLKLPVPVILAVHELVWPDCTAVGLHVTVTAVTVELLEPLPPQATIPRRANTATIRARVRKPFPQT